MFDLKRPCGSCPFRKGAGKSFQLGEDRINEIVNANAFQCHNTVVYGEDDEGNPTTDQGDKPQQCAGLMALLHRERMPNQIMKVAMVLIGFDPKTLDPDNVAYDSLAQAIEEHSCE